MFAPIRIIIRSTIQQNSIIDSINHNQFGSLRTVPILNCLNILAGSGSVKNALGVVKIYCLCPLR